MSENQFEAAASGIGLQGIFGQIFDFLASKCTELPHAVWLIIALVVIVLRVRTFRIVYRGEHREFILETNNGENRKPESQQEIKPKKRLTDKIGGDQIS